MEPEQQSRVINLYLVFTWFRERLGDTRHIFMTFNIVHGRPAPGSLLLSVSRVWCRCSASHLRLRAACCWAMINHPASTRSSGSGVTFLTWPESSQHCHQDWSHLWDQSHWSSLWDWELCMLQYCSHSWWWCWHHWTVLPVFICSSSPTSLDLFWIWILSLLSRVFRLLEQFSLSSWSRGWGSRLFSCWDCLSALQCISSLVSSPTWPVWGQAGLGWSLYQWYLSLTTWDWLHSAGSSCQSCLRCITSPGQSVSQPQCSGLSTSSTPSSSRSSSRQAYTALLWSTIIWNISESWVGDVYHIMVWIIVPGSGLCHHLVALSRHQASSAGEDWTDFQNKVWSYYYSEAMSQLKPFKIIPKK